MAPVSHDRRSVRIAVVEEHLRFENAHDLNGVLSTFGDDAHYEDEAWGEEYHGRDGVRAFYTQLMSALPDRKVELFYRHISDDVIVLEVIVVVRSSVHGGAFLQPVARFKSDCAEFIHSTTKIGLPKNRLITTAQLFSFNSGFSMRPIGFGDGSPLYLPIPSCLPKLSRVNGCINNRPCVFCQT